MRNRFALVVGTVLSMALLATSAHAADVTGGQAKYQQLCATCHGATGRGDGPAAAALNPKPRDLGATTKSDEALKTIISKGGAAAGLSPAMPAWGGMLSAQELDGIIAYIRSLKRIK